MRDCAHCHKRARYGYERSRPISCRDHKNELMFDVTHPKCPECNKRGIYGHKEDKIRYCGDHRVGIDMNCKKCRLCDRQAIYGYVVPEYCRDHRKDDMLSITAKKCYECLKCASFTDGIKSACKIHKIKGMSYIRRKCDMCERLATYGHIGDHMMRCSIHKEMNMISEKKLKSLMVWNNNF